MYKVLLVEDEEIIRNGIRHSIPWAEFGCRVAGEAGDGEEGMRMIEELQRYLREQGGGSLWDFHTSTATD